jgi:hypothetical protein
VAESNTGGWVRRVGSSGGGRTYRKRRPINFYGILVVVVVLGLASVGYARYLNRNPSASATAIPPAVGTKWFAALGIDACGVQQLPLTPNPGSPSGFTALPGGVIQVKPATASEAGNNATLSKFVDGYHGLAISATKLVVPAASGAPDPATNWRAGEKCPAGSKYAGKAGYPLIAYWANVGSGSPNVANDPTKVKFSPNMLVTMFFGPKGVKPPQPPQSAITAMLSAPTTTNTTTSTSLPTTTSLP